MTSVKSLETTAFVFPVPFYFLLIFSGLFGGCFLVMYFPNWNICNMESI